MSTIDDNQQTASLAIFENQSLYLLVQAALSSFIIGDLVDVLHIEAKAFFKTPVMSCSSCRISVWCSRDLRCCPVDSFDWLDTDHISGRTVTDR
jgi:hypothetical protein